MAFGLFGKSQSVRIDGMHRSTRASLLDQDQLLRLFISTRLHAVEVETAGSALGVNREPEISGFMMFVHEGLHQSASDVVETENDPRGLRNGVLNPRDGIEGVGMVLLQREDR